MAPTTRLTKRQILILAGVAVFFVGMIVWVLLTNFSQLKEATISNAFASNIEYSKQIDDKTIYFFSGSAFVAYDLSTQTTKPLTKFYALPTQSKEVVWSKNGALYSASPYTISDQLYATLVQNNLNTFGSYWWLFDFATGKPTLVGTPGNQGGVSEVVWQDDNTYLFSEIIRGQSSLRVMRADIGGSPTEVTSLKPKEKLLWASADTIIFLKPESDKTTESFVLTSRDLKNGQDANLQNGSTFEEALAVGSDGSMLLIVKQKDERPHEELEERARGPLVHYNHKTRQVTKLHDSFSGTAAWRYDNDQWLAVGVDSNLQPISLSNNADDITIYKTPTTQGEDYYAVGRTSQGQIIKDRFDRLFYASDKKIDNLKNAPDSSLLNANTQTPEFSLAYDSDFREYKFYINTPNNKTGLDAAIKFIQEKGLDPYQMRTRWYGSSSPDF